MDDDNREHRRQFIKQVIDGLNALDARQAQRERSLTRPDTRK